ncbi:MAG: hypothetical protein BMS9Abin25_0028 [Gammaproteobacteria bacterium]|nr:MAG: hypothetical protein BMS9Abin25_0028 [Gammaproteobacteria bacterium]
MLNKLRRHFLHKHLWLVVLFGSLIMQSEVLFACELLDSGPQTTCCCDADMSKGCLVGGSCEMTDNDSVLSNGCCEVSTQIIVGIQDLAAADSYQNLQVALLAAPRPPPAPTAIIQTPAPTSGISNWLSRVSPSSLLPSYGPATYLVTQRFRI